MQPALEQLWGLLWTAAAAEDRVGQAGVSAALSAVGPIDVRDAPPLRAITAHWSSAYVAQSPWSPCLCSSPTILAADTCSLAEQAHPRHPCQQMLVCIPAPCRKSYGSGGSCAAHRHLWGATAAGGGAAGAGGRAGKGRLPARSRRSRLQLSVPGGSPSGGRLCSKGWQCERDCNCFDTVLLLHVTSNFLLALGNAMAPPCA